jgi:uncharacterized protein YcnI
MLAPLIMGIVAMLAIAPGAFAHVTITPTHAEPGADVLLTFVVPDENPSTPVVGVTLRPPRAFHYEGVEAPTGWRLQRVGKALAWTGRTIAPGRFETFALTGSAKQSAMLVFAVQERYADGSTARYHPRLVVAAPTAPAARDRGAHTLGLAALVVAIAGAVVAVGTFFFVLALWLRGPGTLQEEKRERVLASHE